MSEKATASATETHEGTAKQRGNVAAKDPSSSPLGGASPEKRGAKSLAALPELALPAFMKDPSNPVGWLVVTGSDFAGDSVRLLRRCTKPDAREFRQIVWACGIGFVLMGFIGYIVKLIFIPINNIIVGG